MSVIQGGVVIEGTYGPILNAGAPVNGTDEIQTITIGGTPTAGSFTLTYDGYTTGAITWTAVDATLVAAVDAALALLPNIGSASNVTAAAGSLSSGIGTITVTFVAALGKMNVALMVATSLLTGTEPTVAVTVSTPGVTATARGAAPGALLVDTTNNDMYINAGTAAAPVWTASVGNVPEGVTASSGEINTLTGVTPGTAAASSALVLGADKNVDTLAIAASGLKIGAGAGTAMTATAAELNVNAGVTPGTATASKTVVLGASKEIATITSATITTLTAPTVNATNIDAGASGTAGSVDIFPATGSKGKLAITVTDQAGDTTVGLVVGAMSGARTLTIADPLAAANFLFGNLAVARTATAAGDGTGAIAAAGGLQFVTVTCDDANKIISLPTPTPGTIVVLVNGATGYELRSSAPNTVLINDGAGGAAVESAIAASTMVIAVCKDATHWAAFSLVGTTLAAVEAAAA